MPRGFPTGSFRRRVATYGERVTFVNEVITADSTTDWDDETVTTTQVSPLAVVQTPRQGVVTRSPEGDEVDVDASVYVHDRDLGGFPIRDGAEGGPTKLTLADGREFMVVTDNVTAANVHELQATRV